MAVGLFKLDIEEVRLRALDRDLTITALGERAGLSSSVLVSANQGGRTTIKSINKIARVLECDPREIIKREQ